MNLYSAYSLIGNALMPTIANLNDEREIMSRQTLKDAKFRVIGYIETAPDGKQTGKDAHFRTVGYYDPKLDNTKDAHFKIVGHGNILSSLVTAS
jgi:hypothetical protein